MNVMSRLLSGLFVLTALLLSLTSFSVDWILELYTPTDQFGNRISLFENQRKSEQLSREIAISMERIESKETVVEACINGEMSLCEAAADFRALHRDSRSWRDPLRPMPEFDDGESWCREVIHWAKLRIRFGRSESQADAVAQRLEEELQEEMDCEGRVSLPD